MQTDTITQHVPRQDSAHLPLCVDLDGTLTHTDLLLESFVLLIRQNPLYLFLCITWLFGGKANFKQQIARRVSLNVASLPYNAELLEFMKGEAARGRDMYLVTGTNYQIAERIADHLGMFKAVVASSPQRNLTGRNKAETLVEMFGQGGFDYVGNETADLPVWKEANAALVVGGRGLAAAAAKVNNSVTVFHYNRPLLRLIIKEMRVYQWVKNLLIFVPLMTSQQFLQIPKLTAAIAAFLSFSLCASAVYLLNDMLDLESDRAHARKRNRPFASGHLPLSLGGVLMVVLLVSSFALAALVRVEFLAVLLIYFVLTLGYSLHLKRKVLVDVFTLAGLYTIRIVAGGAACDIALSVWLTLFSVTLFLSLAMVKRYAELDSASRDGKSTAAGRGYITSDVEIIRSLGTAAGYLAPLVLALYINSPEVSKMYSNPQALWMLFGLLLYWTSRVWFIAFHGRMHDDPIVFAFKDRVSQGVFVLCAICLGLAL